MEKQIQQMMLQQVQLQQEKLQHEAEWKRMQQEVVDRGAGGSDKGVHYNEEDDEDDDDDNEVQSSGADKNTNVREGQTETMETMETNEETNEGREDWAAESEREARTREQRRYGVGGGQARTMRKYDATMEPSSGTMDFVTRFSDALGGISVVTPATTKPALTRGSLDTLDMETKLDLVVTRVGQMQEELTASMIQNAAVQTFLHDEMVDGQRQTQKNCLVFSGADIPPRNNQNNQYCEDVVREIAQSCYGVKIPKDEIAVAHYTAGGSIIARFLHQGSQSAFTNILRRSVSGTRDGGAIRVEISLSKFDRKVRTMLSVLRFHGAIGRFKTANSRSLVYRTNTMQGPYMPIQSTRQLWELADSNGLREEIKEALDRAGSRAAEGKNATARRMEEEEKEAQLRWAERIWQSDREVTATVAARETARKAAASATSTSSEMLLSSMFSTMRGDSVAGCLPLLAFGRPPPSTPSPPAPTRCSSLQEQEPHD